jgi:hypothetical protein
VRVEHHGYRPQRGSTSGGYATFFVTEPATMFPAAKHHPRASSS